MCARLVPFAVAVAFGVSSCGNGSKDANTSSASGSGAVAGSPGSGASSGSGDPGGSNGSGGSSGSSGAGDSGAGGSSGGAGGSAGEPGDPIPVDPDLTGLVPTSNQWVLLSESSSIIVSDLILLDVASGVRHPANEGAPQAVMYSLSLDERTYLYSNGNGSAADQTRLIRLTESGFVPAVSLSGYAGIEGAFTFLSWSSDSRFVASSRGASPSDSFELIDTRLMTRVAFEEMGAISTEFAPTGYYYFYHDPLDPAFAPKYARVTSSGVTASVTLPVGATRLAFDRMGRGIFYAMGEGEQLTLHHRDVLASESQTLSVGAAGESVTSFFPAPGRSAVVSVLLAGGTRVLRRVFVDPTQAAVDLTNPSQTALYSSLTDVALDGSLFLVHYPSSFELIRVEPLAKHQLPVTGSANYGVAGDLAHFQGEDGRLHLARIDAAGELVDVAISEPGQDAIACASIRGYQPATKFVYRVNGGETLVFVDKSANPPVVVGSFTRSSADMTLRCPQWADGDSAAAILEIGDAGSKLYLMRWNGAAPEQPVLVAESELDLAAHAFMFR